VQPGKHMQIEAVTLRGKRITLEPLAREHLPGLGAAIHDGELWKIPVTLVPHPDDLDSFLAVADARRNARQEVAFATIDLASGKVVGSTRFMKIDTRHRRVEIGFTFIAASWQRSHVNTEAKYLMMRHASETWKCARVEFVTDVLNDKSRQAILRLGAREEGVMRNHMIMRDGRHRDSVMHSVIDQEWSQVKANLQAKALA
jgi:RimJ/RimL family protein N-acetyltransferase